MENSSFRDILSQFLEEKSEKSPSQPLPFEPSKEFFAYNEPLLAWQSPDLKQARKGGYPPTPARKNPPREAKIAAKTTVIENIFELTELRSIDQALVGTMIHLGAFDLKNGISLLRVKKAHRRLAKRLHPDRLENGLTNREKEQRQEMFLTLQTAYEALSRSLPTYKKANESASGSESASAAASQRPNAA